jgi:hypothetical protein
LFRGLPTLFRGLLTAEPARPPGLKVPEESPQVPNPAKKRELR